MEHDLFGKPASTFPDHALKRLDLHLAEFDDAALVRHALAVL
jgi:hypothetical protein